MKNIKIHFLLILVILISACGGLTEKQKKSVDDAISALNKLDAGTQVGINKIVYSKMLIEAQALVNQSSSNLSDKRYEELRKELNLAMESYLDAKQLWEIMKNDTGFYVMCNDSPPKKDPAESNTKLDNLFCDPEGKILRDKYNLTVRDPKTKEIRADKSGEIFKKEGISIIWGTAKGHLDRASSLTKEL